MRRNRWGGRLSLSLHHTEHPLVQRLRLQLDPSVRALRHVAGRVTPRQWAHGLVVTLGLAVAITGWTQPRSTAHLWNVLGLVADHVSDVIDDVLPGPAEESIEVQTHVVEPGDTLLKLALLYDTSVGSIAWSNRLIDPDRIMPGQRLIIPPGNAVVHNVREGDTVRSVANRYEADPQAIVAASRLDATIDFDEPVVVTALIVPNPTLPDIAEIGAPEGKLATAVRAPVAYEVQPGDTILSLANQFGVTVPTLLRANNIADPDMVSIGMSLRVLPVSGIEHKVYPGESLADLAAWYEVDMGPIIDFNGLLNPDMVRVGQTLIIPGAARGPKPIPVIAPAPVVRSGSSGQAAEPVARSAQAPRSAQGNTMSAASAAPVQLIGGGSGNAIYSNAMQYLGRPYVWGGTSPSGFDCSGFVWYVHKVSGRDVSRGLWGQMNGGPRVPRDRLQPGDAVFFANTYMPGLSHAGIYIGGGRFVHASDERTGVTVSSMSDSYWGSRFVGASRLY